MRKRRFKTKRRVKKELELDINSLLDILVILLVFLLKSYSASQLEVKLPKNFALPTSKSKDLGEQAPIVKVSKRGEVWVNNDKVVSRFKGGLDADGRLAALLTRLMEVKAQGPKKVQNRIIANEEKKDDLIVNLVFDKDLPFEKMEIIMHTTAHAGYGKYKFLVQAEN